MYASGDGQTIAIGAPDATNGVVSVFRYTSGAWTQLGPDLVGSADGKFGFSLGMNQDGSRVVVGEPRKAFDVNTGVGELQRMNTMERTGPSSRI